MPAPRFLTVCLNPVLQKTLRLAALQRGRVNRLLHHRLDASGKGINVTRVLSQLGEQVIHMTQLGGRFRDSFLDLAARDQLEIAWRESQAEIRFCYTIIEEGSAQATEVVEESEPVAPETEPLLDALYEELLEQCDWVVFSGSKAAGFSHGVVPRWVERAKVRGCRVVLDVRGADLTGALPHSPTVIKPNFDEFVQTFFGSGSAAAGPELLGAVEEEMQRLVRRYGCAVVVTRGTDETLFADSEGVHRMPVAAVPAISSTGSGDAFTAGLVAALAHDVRLADAVRQGQHCGALNAAQERPGVIR